MAVFNWREFLILAHEWRLDQREGVRRTCLGRAYYYVYNLGLNRARQMNWPEPKRSLHRALWEWYQNQADIKMKRMGIYGASMYSLRIDSDYADQPLSDSGAVAKQLLRAQEFEVLVAEMNRQQIPPRLEP